MDSSILAYNSKTFAGGRRLSSLDAWRGLGAIAVGMCHHYLGMFGAVPSNRLLAIPFYYGGFAVEFFFVLSGFGMHLSYSSGFGKREVSFRDFIVARIIKLFPLLWVTIGVMALGQWFLNYTSGAGFLGGNVTVYNLIINLLNLPSLVHYSVTNINSPSWYLNILVLCYIVYFALMKVKMPEFNRIALFASLTVGGV